MKLEVTVGKYTLESLTNGMYSSPLDLYREYIQNSVDSIDEARGLVLNNKANYKIEVCINTSARSIVIRDNGCGIKSKQAIKTLLDIGNSNKRRSASRGFRGIGRLSGLGYCSKLTFSTTAMGESIKTIIVFDTKRLKTLLMSTSGEEASVQDVLEEIVTINIEPEKTKNHYFEVILEDVDMGDKLLKQDVVKEYLIQNCPLPFLPEYKWGDVIKSKFSSYGYNVEEYCVMLDVDGKKEQLYKPYNNILVADRVKKINDRIKDISVIPFYRENKICALLWFAETNYLGTVIDNTIKGIRIRQGNIQVGGKSTLNQIYKEKRFNGWMIGELHIVDSALIINSRRDDFEKNIIFYDFIKILQNWSNDIIKDIRKKSYERSLSSEKKRLLEAEGFDDDNSLGIEEYDASYDISEMLAIDISDSEYIAETDFYNKLSLILNNKKTQTKYSILNINEKLTIEQRKILERVFDIIFSKYDTSEAESFISTISKYY